jgi:prepilin-type N-terminal cleavage/methylation domain-containing protein
MTTNDARYRPHSSGRRTRNGEGGFTLIEFMIAMAITTAVLGATVGLAAQIQRAYTSDLDDVAVEQEVRYALDWIARYIRSAGSRPYSWTACPVFQAVWIDPNVNGDDDDIRIQADINPPNGDCTEDQEDVTIALDTVNDVITLDTGAGAMAMTDPIITGLEFTYLDGSRNPTTVDAQVVYVGVQVTGQSEGRSTTSGFTEFSLSTEVRIRAR